MTAFLRYTPNCCVDIKTQNVYFFKRVFIATLGFPNLKLEMCNINNRVRFKSKKHYTKYVYTSLLKHYVFHIKHVTLFYFITNTCNVH